MAVTEQSTTNAARLPRWDVADIFPSLESPAFAAAHEGLVASLTRLRGLYDEHGVRGGDPHDPSEAEVAGFEQVVDGTNALLDQVRTVTAYISSYVTTDARNDTAQAMSSEVQSELTELARLTKRFEAWVATLGADALVARSQVAADHAYPLRKAQEAAAHQMTELEEGLAADLGLTGKTAWSRLHSDLTSQLTGTLRRPDGKVETLPMTVIRGLATDPDQAVRRAAYEAELEAWSDVRAAVPLAAAMNAIKGETNILNRRRGWSDSLEPALHVNSVDRQTLDAMTEAVVASLPDFRRYLRAKARLNGHTGGLPWYDLFAPAPSDAGDVSWATATERVSTSFGAYSPRLAGLARRAIDERWIDAEPRGGKRGGAFCMGLQGDRSLVMLNFDGSFDAVQTLAHELGHAYHNVNLADRTPMQRALPMALAETASIFCETVVVANGLAQATDSERLAILDTDLQGACQVVVDIHSRFLFERGVFERRVARTLSIGELNELMLDAQRAAYGEGLDPDALHPYMWAVKPHYYSTSYYNWPYTFGLLFGIGLYACYQRDPSGFRGGYDDLLASTGLGSAAELAQRFGIDVRTMQFWQDSLDVLRGRIDEYVRLVEETVTSAG
jgi:oligoendopeptidase F